MKKILLFLLLLLPVFTEAQFNTFQGGTGLTSYTVGDIIYAATTNPIRFTKLNIGSAGACLKVSGGLPAWVACTSGASGTGTVSTSTPDVPGYITFFTSTSATPALIGGDVNFFWDNTLKLLGLSTTTPSKKLSVQGDGLISGNLNVAGIEATSTINTTTTATSTFAGGLSTAGLSSSLGLTLSGGDILHSLANFRVRSNGNVGVGTTSPNNKLSVQGNAEIMGTLNVPNAVRVTSLTATSTIFAATIKATTSFLYANTVSLTDTSNALYDAAGGAIADGAGNRYWSNSTLQSDLDGNIWYSDGLTLMADITGRLYGDGSNLTSINHSTLTNLTADTHTQYALLAGRSGGQSLTGGTAANDDITIQGTSNSTRTTSYVNLQPNGGFVGVGTTSPAFNFSVQGKGLFSGDLSVAGLTATSTVTGTIFTANSTIATSTFAGGITAETSGFIYDFSSNKFGIGTASPRSRLTVSGDIGTVGTIPTLSSCGSSPTITTGSTDTAGEITPGTGATGCTLTFATTKIREPFCVVTVQSPLDTFTLNYSPSASGITITDGNAVTSVYNYICVNNDL